VIITVIEKTVHYPNQKALLPKLRCGRIISDSVIINFLFILTVRKCENLSLFDEVIRRIKSAPHFWATLLVDLLLLAIFTLPTYIPCERRMSAHGSIPAALRQALETFFSTRGQHDTLSFTPPLKIAQWRNFSKTLGVDPTGDRSQPSKPADILAKFIFKKSLITF